jgi:hypothetical protein
MGLLAVCALTLANAAEAAASTSGRSAVHGASLTRAPKQLDVYGTYYGWYDNTPPGCATAYSGCAGGSGTYKDPITFASDKREFPVATLIYYPTVKKYFVMGDDCQECDEDWTGKGPDGGPHLYHVDLWIGGKGGNEFDAINCEDALTQNRSDGAPKLTPFIVDPASDLPVSTQPLFNVRTGRCFGGVTSSVSYGRYANEQTGKCLEDPGDSAKPGVSPLAATCTKTPAERIGFDGAFLTIRGICLQTEDGRSGSPITFATCNGNPREQWEINPNGTITWVQYAMCLAESGSRISLAKCTGAKSERWNVTS